MPAEHVDEATPNEYIIHKIEEYRVVRKRQREDVQLWMRRTGFPGRRLPLNPREAAGIIVNMAGKLSRRKEVEDRLRARLFG